MGIGDEIMAAGEARRAANGTARRYIMTDKRGTPKWHWVWEGNPNIAVPGERADGTIGYVNGRRPYVVDETALTRTFRAYQPAPAIIRLTERALEIKAHVAGGVVFNPTIKYKAPQNKDWGLDRWRQLVQENRDIRWIQVAEQSQPRVRGAEQIITSDFFQACGALAGAAAAVVHEGALHHAAAAYSTPTVVIRGGYISPRVTGYAGQVDLYIEDPDCPEFAELGCGTRVACPHCAAAMERITPALVASALRVLLKQGPARDLTPDSHLGAPAAAA